MSDSIKPRPGAASSASAPRDGIVADLPEARETADAFVRDVASNLATASARPSAMEVRLELAERRLREVEAEARDLTNRLVLAEHQTANLMNLYVATYQLHSTLDPAEVRSTIAEIAISLLGAERFVLLLRSEVTRDYKVAIAEGLPPDPGGLFSGNTYAGSDPMLDATLVDGALRIGPMPGSQAIATVPLVVQDAIVGALVILKLFDHRGALARLDRDLLDLLGSHAASALFAAQLHANADRKLKTLESLVKLARKR
jgi:hypothetical protein